MAANVVENLKALGAAVDFITNTNKITKTRYVDDKTNHLLLRIDVGDDKVELFNTIKFDYALDKYDAIVISDYNKGFLDEYAISAICNTYPNVFVDTKKPIGKYLSLCKYLKINEKEYRDSKRFFDGTPEGIEFNNKTIVTLGKEGCRLGNKIYPVEEVAVKDQSGAGDTFIAGLVWKYVNTQDIDKAITFAQKGFWLLLAVLIPMNPEEPLFL
jgi:D-beta-D-heptose 7-phosphate kinase/D-beta-D-heptose 1-phosphate adenosyltransferase